MRIPDGAAALSALLLVATVAVPAYGRGPGGAGPGGYGMGYHARLSTLSSAARASAPAASSSRAGPEVTPGWWLMSTREQAEHRERMDALRGHDACVAALEQHRTQMAARARERDGQDLPPTRRDACADLKP